MSARTQPRETVWEYAERIHDLEQTDHLLRWDSDVMMPAGGTTARSKQRSSLSKSIYDLRSSTELGRALDRLDEDDLDADDSAIVREVRREHEVASSVPVELNRRLAEATAEAHEAWKRAKEADDWDLFAPAFERHVELRREWAAHVDPDGQPYEVLWKNKLGYESQPYIDLSTVNRVFDRVRDELVPLIEAVHDSDVRLASDAFTDRGPYDSASQMRVNQRILDVVGLDRSRARFDEAPHPFSYGNPYDVRLTTRFDEDDPVDAITATMHEFGHTTYHHGLPREAYGTPLARARGLTIHGSQSGVWENHVSKSRPFWELIMPELRAEFPQLEDVSVREAYEAVNTVQDESRVRTAADELTYHMHVIVRTEIEQALIAGELSVSEVPQVWADKYEQYLGVRPTSARDGPLQDPHWAVNVPGFINYTLGHGVLAAQVWAAMAEDVGDVDERIERGEFDPIHEWMTESIHRHGQRYRPQELVRRATGREITAEPFVEYVTEKFGSLYDL
jgi:carboxypeptidase Taq